MIFAFIAMLGWLAVSIPILWVMALVGRPQFQPLLLIVFVPFAILYMKSGVSLNYLWAGLCMVGAVYFVFRA